MEMVKVVFVKHATSGTQYLFEVTGEQNLKAGDEVACDTVRGLSLGVCSTDSFWVSSPRCISEAFGAYIPLKKVVGRIVRFNEDNPENMGLPF